MGGERERGVYVIGEDGGCLFVYVEMEGGVTTRNYGHGNGVPTRTACRVCAKRRASLSSCGKREREIGRIQIRAFETEGKR